MSDSTLDPNVGLDQSETPDVTAWRAKVDAASKVVESSTDPMIAALLRERDGYRLQGKPDRVKAVDAELKRRGHKDKDDEPKGRQSAPKNTAQAKPKHEG